MTASPDVPPQSAARRQVEFLKRQLWLIVLVVCAALAVAAATSLAQPKVYRASSKIVVFPGATLNPQFGNTAQAFTQTMSPLLKDDIIARQVIRKLGLNETPENVLRHLNVSNTPDSAVLQVSYDSHNPREAVKILTEIGSVFTDRVHQILGGGKNAPVITAKDWGPAHASSTPISPHPVRTLAFAGIIGIALGIVLALLRDNLDERIHRREDMEELFGAPIIAVLPRSMLNRPLLDPAKGADLTGLDAIDSLRLQLARAKARERLITITSGGSGAGRSAVAASIGLALALGGEDVICVDVSPNKTRSLAYYLNAGLDDGAARRLQGPHDIGDALREINLDGVVERAGAYSVSAQLQASAHREDPSRHSVHEFAPMTQAERGRLQLLSVGEGVFSGDDAVPAWSIADLVTELKSHGRFVVVDAPSLPSAAAFAVLWVSDRALVVAYESRTTKEQATSVRKALETLQVSSYGIVSIGSTATAVPPFGLPRSGSDHPVPSRRVRRAR
jgi:capsular polysaccharide biosynthesis protein